MSMGQGESAQGDPSGGATGDQSGAGQQQTGQGNQNQGQQQQSIDWGSNDFLKNVPEADREVVGRYLKSIDSGISRRFQDLHAQYSPYKELGDPEELAQAQQIYQLLNENPKQIYDALSEALKDELGGAQGLGQDELDPDESEFQLPPQIQQKLDQQEQVLQAVAEFILGQQETTQQQQEDQALEQYIDLLKGEFGEFDEDFVLTKMFAGMDGEAAVKAWQQTIQNAMNGAGQAGKIPPILGGGGVHAQENSKTVKDLDRKETKALVAEMLAATKSQGN